MEEGICQGCGGPESRAAGEWNEKAVEWRSKCLREMERKTLPGLEGVRRSLSPGLPALGTPAPLQAQQNLTEAGSAPLL